MRLPDTGKRAVTKTAIAATLLAGFMTLEGVPLSFAASPDEELTRLRKALILSSERQNEISGRLQLLGGEIASLKEKSVKVANRLINIDRGLLETEERLVDIQQVETQTLKTLAEQNEGLAGTLSALLQLSRQPEGSLIGSPENLVNNLRAATLLKAAIPALKKESDHLSEQLDTLASLRDNFIREQQKYADLRKSRKSEQKTLTALLESKRTARAALSGLNAKEERQQRKLNQEARDLVSLMSRLEKEKQNRLAEERQQIEAEIARQEALRRENAARREEERQQAKREQQQEKQQTEARKPVPKPVPSHKSGDKETQVASIAPSRSTAPIGSKKPFARAKGTLFLPVGGKIVSKFKKSGSSGRRNGIVIETRGDAAVISPYDGQIAFAGPFRNYGLLLIIDHGEGYHTLLAGMGAIDGSVGQLLLAGEPVGQMKNDKSGKPTLYMELRVKGSPVNPVPWLKTENRKVSG
ncbi:MAG: peptidoglycan DD-metalloendopeptidase family protein [Sneathiella sp.]